ncbi:hypothetical protein P6N53_13335 [Desulforamulus aquiferis]|uniref:Uncharacterized protein n=1 Tax=Desulforamulus aquiferis TaxID=1397668 RepID=A0AAW7ZFN5_9FIRM|nr:hypothetical protein [Desulforamulus aquiferis]
MFSRAAALRMSRCDEPTLILGAAAPIDSGTTLGQKGTTGTRPLKRIFWGLA